MHNIQISFSYALALVQPLSLRDKDPLPSNKRTVSAHSLEAAIQRYLDLEGQRDHFNPLAMTVGGKHLVCLDTTDIQPIKLYEPVDPVCISLFPSPISAQDPAAIPQGLQSFPM